MNQVSYDTKGNMYGPTDTKNIGFLIDFACKVPCFPIPGHGKWPRQPIYIDDVCGLVITMMKQFPQNTVFSINGKDVIYFRDMIKIVLKQLGGFKFRVFLPVWLFKFLMISYQNLSGKEQFTSDQVESLTAGEVFWIMRGWMSLVLMRPVFRKELRRCRSAIK